MAERGIIMTAESVRAILAGASLRGRLAMVRTRLGGGA